MKIQKIRRFLKNWRRFILKGMDIFMATQRMTLFTIQTGDLDDWGYGEQKTKNKVFSVTVEVGDSFQPPGSEISGLIEENLKPAIWMIFAAGRL